MTIKGWLLTLACVFAGWLATLLGVMVLSDAAPGAIVLLPADDFATRLPDGAAIVGTGPAWVAIRSEAPGLGAALYRAGGRLVLPAGLPGCLPLPDAG
jgi:shikimate kinase